MVNMILGMLLRHGLTIFAGYLVNKGIADASAATAITGGIAAAAGLGLSALDKNKTVKKLNDAFAKLNN